jgi:hypothetical protein
MRGKAVVAYCKETFQYFPGCTEINHEVTYRTVGVPAISFACICSRKAYPRLCALWHSGTMVLVLSHTWDSEHSKAVHFYIVILWVMA